MVVGGRCSKGRQRGVALFPASTVDSAEADDQIAQGGHIAGTVLFLNGRAILTEGDIAHVMEDLDAPVTPAPSLDLSSIQFRSGAADDEHFHFLSDPHGFEVMSGADHHRGLDGVRESGALRSDREGIDRTGFMPAVGLVQSDVRREKNRRSRLWKAWRVCQKAWADCL